MLDAIKDSIINAYEAKTGLRRTQIGHMMSAETTMSAHKAIELGFADGILYTEDAKAETYEMPAFMFSRMAVVNSLLAKLPDPTPLTPIPTQPPPVPDNPKPFPPQGTTTVESLYKRLSLLSH